jgi:small subunit ribosomal protein S6
MKGKYDLTIILRPDLKDDGKDESVKKYEKLVKTLGGVPGKVMEMGKKQLAYKIKNKSEGVYVNLGVEMPSAGVVELEKKLAVDNDILRHLLVRV